MSSSHTATQSKAASRTYRIRNLWSAGINIDEVEKGDLPDFVRSFHSYLTCDDFTGVVPVEAVSVQLSRLRKR